MQISLITSSELDQYSLKASLGVNAAEAAQEANGKFDDLGSGFGG